jgi:hypothetical protein
MSEAVGWLFPPDLHWNKTCTFMVHVADNIA